MHCFSRRLPKSSLGEIASETSGYREPGGTTNAHSSWTQTKSYFASRTLPERKRRIPFDSIVKLECAITHAWAQKTGSLQWSPSARKTVAITFRDRKVVVECTPRGETVDSAAYCDTLEELTTTPRLTPRAFSRNLSSSFHQA